MRFLAITVAILALGIGAHEAAAGPKTVSPEDAANLQRRSAPPQGNTANGQQRATRKSHKVTGANNGQSTSSNAQGVINLFK